MRKFSLFIFILLFLIHPVFAKIYDSPSNLASISKQIPKMGSVKCKFRQEKYMQNISKPLVSSGNFEFVENKGVYFYTLYPYKSTVDYTNKNYRQINDIVTAISTKKYSRLEKEFSFYFEGNIEKWSLGMKPKKNSKSYGYISSIIIEGNKNIDKISIFQANGNKTLIWFKK